MPRHPAGLIVAVLIGLLLAIALGPGDSVARPGELLAVEGGTQWLELGPHLMLLEDPARTLSDQDVATLPDSAFTPATSEIPTIGVTRSAWWARVAVRPPPRADDFRIVSADPEVFRIDLTQFDATLARVGQASTGILVEPWQRMSGGRRFILPVWLKPGQDAILVFRIESPAALQLGFALATREAMEDIAQDDWLLLGAFFATLLTSGIYIAVAWLSLRERALLVLLAALGCLSAWLAVYDGMVRELVTPDYGPLFFDLGTCALGLGSLLLLEFVREFLDLRRQAPDLDRWLSLARAGPIATFVAAALDRHLLSFVSALAATTLLILILVVAALCWRRRLPLSEVFLAAWSLPSLTSIAFGLSHLGILPGTTWTYEGAHLGIAAWAMMSAVGVAYMLATRQADREQRLRSHRDVLEQRVADRTEALQAALQAAQQADIAKSAFLATMSHELRTPLNAILGFSEIIRDQSMGPNAMGQYREYATHIHDAGSHLLNLISDILDLSKISAGRLELHPEPVDPAEQVEAAMEMFHRDAAQRGISLSGPAWPQGAPAEPLLFQADRRAIRQMLLNLMSNALKFTPRGGNVRVEIERLPDGEVTLAVIDTGIGMDAAGLAKALEPFGQVDGPISRSEPGTGLGLPIVKALIEAHGGRLIVRTALGHGTAMVLVFPAALVGPARPAQPAPAAA
ncbi:ATP-binding protein [Zavarzinia sp. CC-PAN008]|uniref:ATP-binding protein n=1 Tax=Zavarzinia sp. CC-PAN008 TaxID=3243332 RepID=UPI003F742322